MMDAYDNNDTTTTTSNHDRNDTISSLSSSVLAFVPFRHEKLLLLNDNNDDNSNNRGYNFTIDPMNHDTNNESSSSIILVRNNNNDNNNNSTTKKIKTDPATTPTAPTSIADRFNPIEILQKHCLCIIDDHHKTNNTIEKTTSTSTTTTRTRWNTSVEENADDDFVVWGRNDLLQRLYRCCNHINHTNPRICQCQDCSVITQWAKLYLSRSFLRCRTTIRYNQKNNHQNMLNYNYNETEEQSCPDCSLQLTTSTTMTEPIVQLYFKRTKYFLQSHVTKYQQQQQQPEQPSQSQQQSPEMQVAGTNSSSENENDGRSQNDTRNNNNKKIISLCTSMALSSPTRRTSNATTTKDDDWMGPFLFHLGDRIQFHAPNDHDNNSNLNTTAIMSTNSANDVNEINTSSLFEFQLCRIRWQDTSDNNEISKTSIVPKDIDNNIRASPFRTPLKCNNDDTKADDEYPMSHHADSTNHATNSSIEACKNNSHENDDNDQDSVLSSSSSSSSTNQSMKIYYLESQEPVGNCSPNTKNAKLSRPIQSTRMDPTNRCISKSSTNHVDTMNYPDHNTNLLLHPKWTNNNDTQQNTNDNKGIEPTSTTTSLRNKVFRNNNGNMPITDAEMPPYNNNHELRLKIDACRNVINSVKTMHATATSNNKLTMPHTNDDKDSATSSSTPTNSIRNKKRKSMQSDILNDEIPSINKRQLNETSLCCYDENNSDDLDDELTQKRKDGVVIDEIQARTKSKIEVHPDIRSSCNDDIDPNASIANDDDCIDIDQMVPIHNDDIPTTTIDATTATDNHATAPTGASQKFVLFFLEKGIDMSRLLIQGNSKMEGLKTHAEKRGATVLDHFDKDHPPWPTHIVISESMSSSSSNPNIVANALGFSNSDEMSNFIGVHNIVCVTRKWASRGNRVVKPPFQEPTMMEKYLGIWPTINNNNKKKHDEKQQQQQLQLPQTAIREQQHLAHNGTPIKGIRFDTIGSNTPPQQKSVPMRNQKLSELFHTLSKLHKECPLLNTDEWRSYSFQLLAGRLRHLDFEITDDYTTLEKLKNIKGFGSTSMQIIKEYLRTGSTVRTQEFSLDKRRIAMRAFMNIWGVGRMRASELVNAGYRTIGSVRNAIKNGMLKLDRNQYIGLMHYEDLLDEMGRPEVEQIAAIVFDAIKERYPSAEITIMGSYRRGKTACGDVDILITHPDYYDYAPPRALGQIVDDLKSSGFITHHLTFINGMKHEKFESIPPQVASKLSAPSSYGRSRDKVDAHNSSSWMGIVKSPVVEGKQRRVDIKFYPYAQRVFAALYFTGNGYFNRSMRLWATRKYNYTLSDHGLFDKDTNHSVMDKIPVHEKEVFDKLELVWKEPSERDCFDAVECKTSGRDDVMQMLGNQFSNHDIEGEASEHRWVS